jgi:hypothetical protein
MKYHSALALPLLVVPVFSAGLCASVMAQQDMPQKVGLQREHTVLSTGISEGQTTEELRKSGINCHAQQGTVHGFKVDSVRVNSSASSSNIAGGDEITDVNITSKFVLLTLKRGQKKINVQLPKSATKGSDSSDFDQGIDLYKTGDYNAARLCFWRRSQESPKDYRSHYYLANSLLQMKDLKNARLWYANCLGCGPDVETAQNCSKALSYLDNGTGSKAKESEKQDLRSRATNTLSAGTPLNEEKLKPISPLCSPTRDTAGEAVMRHIKQPPAGFINRLGETERGSSNILFSVKYGLETIPESVLSRLLSAGYSILITPTILDALPGRAGGTLRGYGDDSNYDNAAALFKTESRQIVIAEKFQLHKNSADLQNNDFATQSVRHELGHAVDCEAGYPSRGKEFKDAYDKDERKISGFDRNRFKYFLQAGDSGRSELFAEFFAAKYTPENWQSKNMIDLLNAFPDG